MPIVFHNEHHQRHYTKLGCFLDELGFPYTPSGVESSYVVNYGSTAAVIVVRPTEDNDALIGVVAVVSRGSRLEEPALLEFLVRENQKFSAGKFAIDAHGQILCFQSTVSSSMSTATLRELIMTVLSRADEADDAIVAQWGGTLTRPQENEDEDEDEDEDESEEDHAHEKAKPSAQAAAQDTTTDALKTLLPPTAKGVGDGLCVGFLFGLKSASAQDQWMRQEELSHLDDDFALLRAHGYTVLIDKEAGLESLQKALRNEFASAEPLRLAGLYWSSHGHEDGSLETCTGARIRPTELPSEGLSEALRLVVLSSCYVGSRASAWRKAMGGKCLVVGWGKPVTLARTVDFLVPDEASDQELDDLLRRYLLENTPIPPEPEAHSLRPSLLQNATNQDISTRLGPIAESLNASLFASSQAGVVRVELPLEDGRSHSVHVGIVLSTEAYCAGEAFIAMEADVGAISPGTDLRALLQELNRVAQGRLVLTAASEADSAPRLTVQALCPSKTTSADELRAQLYHTAARADVLELQLFGTKSKATSASKPK